MNQLPKLLSALALSGFCAASSASGREAAALDPIRPVAQCLRIDRVSDWKAIDDRHLLVKAQGGRYFDIALQDRCGELVGAPYVGFRDGNQPVALGRHRSSMATAQNPVTTDGRICGDLGDAVIPRDGSNSLPMVPCRIARIRPTDREAWKDAGK